MMELLINTKVRCRTCGEEKIQQELDKCDLLCANCHRIRHNEKKEN